LKENIKEIFGYNDYKEFNELGNIILYSNLSSAQRNQCEGKRIKYVYDENNRLITEIIEIKNYYDHISAYEVFEKKFEYNDFGYRISEFKTKLIHNFHSDPNRTSINSLKDDLKRYPIDVNDLISIIDIKLKNNKVVFKKSTDLLNNIIILEEYKYENKKIIEEKFTDFQNNTISKTINEYENDLIITRKKYSSKNNEIKTLNAETTYQYVNGLIISIKNYIVKNDSLELDFETKYKYDSLNRIVEEVKANFEKKEYISSIDYYYSTYNEDNDGFTKIIKIEFEDFDGDFKRLLVNKVSIDIFNELDEYVTKISNSTYQGIGYNFYRDFTTDKKYSNFDDVKFEEINLDEIKNINLESDDGTSVEVYDYGYLVGMKKRSLLKKTLISISADNLKIIGYENYNYYLNS
jgi:hypothetical protein